MNRNENYIQLTKFRTNRGWHMYVLVNVLGFTAGGNLNFDIFDTIYSMLKLPICAITRCSFYT